MMEYQCSNVLAVSPTPNDDVVLSLACEELSISVLPGQYVYLSLDESIAHKAIAYVLSTDPKQKRLSFYILADVFRQLKLQGRDKLWVSQPTGDAFPALGFSSNLLIIADKTGLPSALFLSQIIAELKSHKKVFVLLYSDGQFPFRPQPSRFLVSGVPPSVIAACPLLEDRNISNRLISNTSIPGCYEGSLTEFLNDCLLEDFINEGVTVYASGGSTFMKEVRSISDNLGVMAHLIELP